MGRDRLGDAVDQSGRDRDQQRDQHVAAGNTVVFAPHPAAKRVSQLAVTRINEAVVAAGGPDNVVVTVAEPNIETA